MHIILAITCIMGRRRKWTPRKLTLQDFQASEAFLHIWAPPSTAERVRQDYEHFCRINNIDFALGYAAFVGQMIMSGLSEGTIETYLGYAAAPRRGRAYRAAALAHTDADCKHAHDVKAGKLQEIIKSQSDPCLQALLWLLFVTGSRNKDICRLRHSQIKLNYRLKCTSVEYRVTKNLRKRSARRVITVPWKWRMPPPAKWRIVPDQ